MRHPALSGTETVALLAIATGVGLPLSMWLAAHQLGFVLAAGCLAIATLALKLLALLAPARR